MAQQSTAESNSLEQGCSSTCHELASCVLSSGVPECLCQRGTYGDGVSECTTSAFVVRIAWSVAQKIGDGETPEWLDEASIAYAEALTSGNFKFVTDSARKLERSFHRSATGDGNSLTIVVISSLYGSEQDANHAWATVSTGQRLTSLLAHLEQVVIDDMVQLIDAPHVLRWDRPVSSVELESITFKPTCGMSDGCWVVDVVYPRATEDSVGVAYMPRSADWLSDPFPCSGQEGEFLGWQGNLEKTNCCVPDLASEFHVNSVLQTFSEWYNLRATCDAGQAPRSSAWTVDNVGQAVAGKFLELPSSSITTRGARDRDGMVVGVRFELVEDELKRKAHVLKSMSVQSRIDTMVGVASMGVADEEADKDGHRLVVEPGEVHLMLIRSAGLVLSSASSHAHTAIQNLHLSLHVVHDARGTPSVLPSARFLAVHAMLPQADAATPVVLLSSIRVGKKMAQGMEWVNACDDSWQEEKKVGGLVEELGSQECAPPVSLCAAEARVEGMEVVWYVPDVHWREDRVWVELEWEQTMRVSAELQRAELNGVEWCACSVANVGLDEVMRGGVWQGLELDPEGGEAGGEVAELVFSSETPKSVREVSTKALKASEGWMTVAALGDTGAFEREWGGSVELHVDDVLAVHLMEGAGDAPLWNEVEALLQRDEAFSPTALADGSTTLLPSEQLLSLCPEHSPPPSPGDLFPAA
eukprot:CAMPEP_0181291148 /NCGR_PEP_ID=MMETSP1101-20121128/1808_1 /TAXON_ID=46948 /ORGANISM="Rhodomonas abbreviata, Strain Caron Lab Isolate" /LENGTH=698 /DNA_ID=CAMNT_0023395511 /DNA_START=99 /DNA_END=2191 /DNA_ORIENTATION=-